MLEGLLMGGPEGSEKTTSTRRKTIVWTVISTLALAAVVVLLVVQVSGSRRWLAEQLDEPGEDFVTPPVDLRNVVLAERARSLGQEDLQSAAAVNATLSQEALLRALAVHKAWLGRRHPETHLYAQSAETPEWNFRNTAADFFAFHLHAGLLLNPPAMESLKETLAAEAALRTEQGLCRPVLAATRKPVDVDHDELIFGSSEYAKDGLLSIYERHGGGLIGERLLAIIDAIIAASKHNSKFGALPGMGAEVNGNLLQLCGRLSYAEGRPEYAEFAARIADAMIQQAMAANHGLPPKFYNYESGKVVEEVLKLKDHGNEAVLGLAEAYAMAVDRRSEQAWADRADRWGEPLARMFEIILEHGINEDGLLVGTMEPSPPRPGTEQLCDNWGYILTGAILFTDAARRDAKLDPRRLARIEERIDGIARASFARPIGLPWGNNKDMDSEADVLESGIYIAAYRPALREEALRWVNRQIIALFRTQKADGTAVGAYLDGNFIRTSLLYADIHSGGWRADPWREDVMVGMATDDSGNTVVTIRCTEPYKGTLRAPEPRHRVHMKLPWNWARLNSWPEWDVVEGPADMLVSGGPGNSNGSKRDVSADQLRAGLPMDIPAFGEIFLSFTPPTNAPAAKAPAPGAAPEEKRVENAAPAAR